MVGYIEPGACNPIIWEVEAGGSGVQDQPLPHSKFGMITE